MHEYTTVLQKYADFSGRARRREYWMFLLIHLFVAFGALMVDLVMALVVGIGGLYFVYTLGTFLPALGVSVRRLHDSGRSGWWLLLAFVPLIGLLLIVFMCQDSDSGTNDYGPNPKQSMDTGAAGGLAAS